MTIFRNENEVKVIVDGNNIVNSVSEIDVRLRIDEIITAKVKLFPEKIYIEAEKLYTEIENVKYMLVRVDENISLPILTMLKEAKEVIENLQVDLDVSSGSGEHWNCFKDLLLAQIMKPEHEEIYRKICRFIDFNERSDKNL